jgi:hypothetical protein
MKEYGGVEIKLHPFLTLTLFRSFRFKHRPPSPLGKDFGQVKMSLGFF